LATEATSEVGKHIVKRAVKSKFESEASEAPRFWIVKPREELSALPITRLAWSKDSSFLASLALGDRCAHITVWDMKSIEDQSIPGNMSVLQPTYAAIAVPYYGLEDLRNLSIGFAISPTGGQVAIYQEPEIGQWVDGTKLEKCSFRIRVFNNPLVRKADSVTLTVDGTVQNEIQLEQQDISPHQLFDSFIGYGAFLTETENNDRDMKVNENALPINMSTAEGCGAEGCGTEDCSTDDGEGGRSSNDGVSSDDNQNSSTTANTLFVACNGVHINVFRLAPGNEWTFIRAIRLTDLVTTFSRRIMCKTMMETISGNTFMWLEDNGLCCTLWDLQKGSNVSYIFSTDNARFSDSSFRGSSRMAISPDESIVALAREDILTTYYASSGIQINTRKYSSHTIEYIGFYGQTNQLFVIVRRPLSRELGSRILDPFQLKSQIKVNRAPIPAIGKTILAFLHDGGFKDKGLVCEADGNKLRCYVSYEPVEVVVTENENTLVKSSCFSHPLQKNDEKMESQEDWQEGCDDEVKHYELRTSGHKEPFPDGDGSKYWVLRVQVAEVIRKHLKVIFSFVPEPWMRVSTEDGKPKDLQSVYSLPGGTRFAVAGMQTLQIWSFPTDKTPHFSLDFIWSRPRKEKDLHSRPYGKTFKSDPVGEYYHNISRPNIYLDEITGGVTAYFKRKDNTKHHIGIPAASGSNTRSTFTYCARSIHLLASAYAYSEQGTKRTSGDSTHRPLNFGEHADAIARFTRGHINRVLSDMDFYRITEAGEATPTLNNDTPGNPRSNSAGRVLSIGNLAKRTRNLNQSKPVVTVLTLLLSWDDLKDANHTFVKGLLSSDSDRWVPHADKTLNPIECAIDIKDEQLLKMLIDYCINCAKKYHPAYMTPVEQCLAKLLVHYPDIAAYVFRSTSYIPAHNSEYVASHAIGTITRLRDWFRVVIKAALFSNKTTPKQFYIDDNMHAVFTLRSQLPTVNSPPPSFMNGDDMSQHWSETRSTQRRDVRPTLKSRSHKIYVSPFQFQSIKQPLVDSQSTSTQKHKKSVFDYITGRDFFDNPAIVAIVRFKWFKFGIKYWLARLLLALVYFILVVVITAKQISVSSLKEGEVPTSEEIEAQYLPEWRPIFVLAMAGRYDPVSSSFDKGPGIFKFTMAAFYFITAILLLNILIALMNDAFENSMKESEMAYWELLSEVVAEAETIMMRNMVRERGDYYPKHIYYCASAEEAEKFHSKSSLSDASNDSGSRGNDEVKQELAELKELVKNLASQLKTSVPS
ncbi:hypothetical protein BGZ65_000251, partial [Modicella reniformis]